MNDFNKQWRFPYTQVSKYQGLVNQGSTCYLNSMLQVLFMTPEFREAVENYCEHSKTSHIDIQLKVLFNELKTSSPTTRHVIHKLGIENVWEQRDAAEYLEKILRLASPQASQIFHGGLTHRTACSQCSESTDVDGAFWTLNLAINNASTGNYNVEDGLKAFFSKSTFTGDNQLYCDHCEAKADATIECKFGKHPQVLVLLLKRFELDYYSMEYVKNDSPVDIPLNIEIPEGRSYELYATVNHYGNLRSGHYTATIKSLDDGKGSWYMFDDSRVALETFNPEKNHSAYLLLYRRNRLNDSPQGVNHGSSVDPPEFVANQKNGTTATTIGDDKVDDDDDDNDDPKTLLLKSPEHEKGNDLAGTNSAVVDIDVVVVHPQTDTVTESEDREADSVNVGKDEGDKSAQPMTGSLRDKSRPSSSVPMGEWQVLMEQDEGVGSGDVMLGDVLMAVRVSTNELKSDEPGDHTVQQEASNSEGSANESRNNERKRSRHSDVYYEEVEMKGDVVDQQPSRTNGSESYRHGGADSVENTHMQEHKCGPGDIDVIGKKIKIKTRGEGVGSGDDMLGDVLMAVRVSTNQMKSDEPGDHTVQQEASNSEGSANESRNNERKRSRHFDVHYEEVEMKGNVVDQQPSRTNGSESYRHGGADSVENTHMQEHKWGPGDKIDKIKNKKQILCCFKKTSDQNKDCF